MRAFTILLISSLMVLGSVESRANGNRIGNGGKGIVCTAKNGRKDVQVLDFFEAPNPLRKDLEKLSRDAVIKKILENLKRLAPQVAKQYEGRFAEIMSEIEFKSGVTLMETTDAYQLALPSDQNCKLEQIVIRRTDTDLLTKTFLFSEDLWRQMSGFQQAGLLLHEIVYEHFWKLGETDSIKARKIVGYLASEKALKDSPEDFWKMIRSLDLPLYR
jgi:hypothetical protein